MEVFVFICQICSSQIKGHFSDCIVCSKAWAVFTEGDTEKWLGYHVKLGRRGMTEELAFALADVCGKCAMTPQAGIAPRLISLNVWGAALLPLHGSHPWEQLEGEASVRTKILLLVTCSFQLPPMHSINPSPSSCHVTAACLAGSLTSCKRWQPAPERQEAGDVSCWWPPSSPSCWPQGQGPGVCFGTSHAAWTSP